MKDFFTSLSTEVELLMTPDPEGIKYVESEKVCNVYLDWLDCYETFLRMDLQIFSLIYIIVFHDYFS